jgi:hypothetical protein
MSDILSMVLEVLDYFKSGLPCEGGKKSGCVTQSLAKVKQTVVLEAYKTPVECIITIP